MAKKAQNAVDGAVKDPHRAGPILTQQQVQAVLDGKTKPIGALGQLEALAMQIALLQQSLTPVTTRCCLTIFAADHGIALEGVSAFPQIVTRQMVQNFLSGGAAANVIARSVGADIQVVDAGVAGDRIQHPRLIDQHIAPGTQSSLHRPAMTADHYALALERGQAVAQAASHDTLCFGEMGIGNTSAASLVAAKILNRDVGDLVGRGTGVDDAQLAQKTRILISAAKRTAPHLAARDALIEYGGFEMVMMCGAMMQAASQHKTVLVDGYIATTTALCAVDIAPQTRKALVFAHRSAEQGHGFLLQHMAATPLLDLHMRLGEGTGALLAWPLVQAAGAMLRDMARFEDAGVSGKT